MRLTHPFIIAALFCAGQAFAQTTPKPTAAATQTSESLASAADQLNISQHAQFDFFAESGQESGPMGRIQFDQYNPRQRSVELPPYNASDVLCYKIASYLMVRDDPNSDSTHIVGYTTCVPAARFRVYTTVEHRR